MYRHEKALLLSPSRHRQRIIDCSPSPKDDKHVTVEGAQQGGIRQRVTLISNHARLSVTFKASPRIPAESFEEKVKISNLGYPVGGSKYDPDI